MSSQEDDFDELYTALNKQVLGWCHRFYSDDHQIATDLANEVWLQVWVNIDKLDFKGSPTKTAGWLKVVTRNMCARHHRDSLHTRRRVPNQETLVSHFESGDWVTEEFDPVASTANLPSRAWAVVDTLPDRQKDCLTLKYWNDLSVKQVAEKLGISVSMAETALYKGRQAVKSMLGEV